MAVMAVTLGLSGTAVYIFFSYSLYKQQDNELLTLAKAAAPFLAIAKKEVSTNLEKDIPWNELFKSYQSLEWFSVDRKLLSRGGPVLSNLPLGNRFQMPQQQGQVRTLTIPVYGYTPNPQQPQLEGYVRASESMEAVEKTLTRLAWGLGLGGTIALGLSGIGGMWLTRQSIQPVEQSFHQLKQFTADASHELRSPLTAIKTSVEVMLTHLERLHPSDAKRVAAISSGINQMTHLLEDLLFLARTDAPIKSSALELTLLPLNEVLQELVELLEPQADAKVISLKSQLENDVFVIGNAAQLTRLFANLLENALSYTPAGGTVTVYLSIFDRTVVVNVEDTGIGIALEHLPFVFHRFWRTDKARSQRKGGMGLGLAIAQAIAQSHGGEITVSSQVEVGSCFRVRLPRHQ